MLPDTCCARVRGFAQIYVLAGLTAATDSPLGPIARHSMRRNAARSNSRCALECPQEPTQRARALPSSRSSPRSRRAKVPSGHHPFAFGNAESSAKCQCQCVRFGAGSVSIDTRPGPRSLGRPCRSWRVPVRCRQGQAPRQNDGPSCELEPPLIARSIPANVRDGCPGDARATCHQGREAETARDRRAARGLAVLVAPQRPAAGG